MAAEKKTSQRDIALINILERVADQLTQQDQRIDEISKLLGEQDALHDLRSDNMEKFLREQFELQDRLIDDVARQQSEMLSIVERVVFKQNTWQQDVGPSIEKLNQDFQRYRSDMLGIANEQDRIFNDMKESTKRQGMLASVQEIIDRRLQAMDERAKLQEKPASDHYEYTVKQAEAQARLIAEGSRSFEKLHMDTEKRLGETQKETHRRMEELRIETMRRLLALDGIEEALQVLMVRTEPPEKKPFWVKRVIRRIGLLFKRVFRRTKKV